jgi:hypothetical protein
MFPSLDRNGAGSDDRLLGPSQLHSHGLELPLRLATLRTERCDGHEIPLHFADEARSL